MKVQGSRVSSSRWAGPSWAPGQRVVLPSGPSPAPRLPSLGHRDSQLRPGAPREMLRGWPRVCCWSCLPGLDSVGMGRAAVLLAQRGRPAAVWEGRPSFPALLRNHSMAPAVCHLPKSTSSSRNTGPACFPVSYPPLLLGG